MFQGKDLENIIKSVSNTEEGLSFIYYLIDDLGTFSTKVNIVDSKLQNAINNNPLAPIEQTMHDNKLQQAIVAVEYKNIFG